MNEDSVQVDHNLFEVVSDNQKMINSLKDFLNSSLFSLIREVNSRVNLGDGATKTEGVDWKNLMLVPKDPLKIDLKDEALFNKPIKSINNEVKDKIKRELDVVVMESLGLKVDLLKELYSSLPKLVEERLSLPKMRKKKQKEKPQRVFEEVKETVIKDCLPDGLKSFPQDFYLTGYYEKLKFDEYSTTGTPLNSDSFFNDFQMKDQEGKIIFSVDSENKAEFCEILTKHNTYLIKIPKEEKIIEEILSNYKKYLKEIVNLLTENSYTKTHDWEASDIMAKEILNDFGVDIHVIA